MGTELHVRVLRDCARRLELEYALPAPLTGDWLRQFDPTDVHVDRFSEKLPGARDHFVISLGDTLRLSGAMGGRLLKARFERGHSSGHMKALVHGVERCVRGLMRDSTPGSPRQMAALRS